MNTADERIIELSKTKIVLLVLAAAVFVALGCWMLQMDPARIEASRRFNEPWIVYGLGLVCAVFFGMCGFVAIKKLFDSAPGLVLNAKGVHDNSSGVAVGFVPWSDILGFEVYEVMGQKSLLIKVASPEKYIGIGNPLKQWLRKSSHKTSGSPIAISSKPLKISFDELQETCNRYFAKYGRSA